MERILERCAGLDVHKKTVVACALTPAGSQVRSFGTMTEDLLSLVDWLLALEISEIAMESTGVYWKPVYNLLEAAELRPIVCNAKGMRNVPGRKTDVKDAEWIAQLHQHVASSLLGVPSLRGAASRTPWAAEYCEAFAAYARPHVRAAIAAFGQCHAFAERHRGAAAVKKTCLDGQDSLGRGRSRPELLPAAGELPTKPRRAGVQLDVD